MYKFKASKYKNATPTIAKKEEYISDFTSEAPMTFGNHAAASGKLLAFCVGSATGGKVMVLDVNSKGRLGGGPGLNAHFDAITSMDFSPFNHCRLATASADNSIKIWDLPADGITKDYTDDPVWEFSGLTGRPECIAFHPVADDILAVACGANIYVYNLENGERVLEMNSGADVIQSISWKKDGMKIAATTKDCKLLICDPREGKVVMESKAHENHKESRVVWLGLTNKVLTTGFARSRTKELSIWDVSSGKLENLHTEEFSTGTGVLMPFYDEDTGMLLVAAKGESSITFLEFFEEKDPPLQMATQQILQNQTKGMCCLPKLGVNAAEGEVNRIFQLGQKVLVPIPWIVPRRSLRDFPIDLFPHTASDEPALTAQQWLDGENKMRNKTSLEPGKRKPLRLGNSTQAQENSPAVVNNESAGDAPVEQVQQAVKPKENVSVKPAQRDEEKQEVVTPKYKPFTGVRQSKFRHWKGKIGHPSSHVTNIEPISLSVSPSSDTLRCSELYGAVPLKGPGGQVAIIKLSSPGRMSNNNSLTLQNGKGIVDMQWNPFNSSQLAVALESYDVKVWNIPNNKFGEEIQEADIVYKGHYSKPVVLCFHPLADNIIASAETDGRIVIWDASNGETYLDLSYGEGEAMSLAWSSDGKYLAASCRDKKLRIFEPRKTTDPIQVGPGLPGTRSSRLAWVCNDKFLALSGFDDGSCRTISLHSASDLGSGMLSEESYSNSPSVMMIHYDADSSTLFFAGKGDTTLHSLEISASDPPHLFRIASFATDFPVQGISFLTKKKIDPKKVEFAQAWVLTKSMLQPMSFSVPRVKMDYFQDDLFPPTPVIWEKTMTASEWVGGANKKPRKQILKPAGMTPLSEAPPDEVKPKKYASYDASTYKSDEQKKEELLEAMSGKLDLDKQLEQDTMEGVDEDEWDDY